MASIRYGDGQGKSAGHQCRRRVRCLSSIPGGDAVCRRTGDVRQRARYGDLDVAADHLAAQRLVRERRRRRGDCWDIAPWSMVIERTMWTRRPTCTPTAVVTLTRFPRATTNGQLVAQRREDRTVELFALGDGTILGISLDGQAATALALDADGNPLRAGGHATQSRDRLRDARSAGRQLRPHSRPCSRRIAHVRPDHGHAWGNDLDGPGGHTLTYPGRCQDRQPDLARDRRELDRFHGRPTRDHRAEQDPAGLFACNSRRTSRTPRQRPCDSAKSSVRLRCAPVKRRDRFLRQLRRRWRVCGSCRCLSRRVICVTEQTWWAKTRIRNCSR